MAGSSGLTKDEVARMVNEAESHAAEDKARRELIDARNQADALVYSVEKTLADNRERLSASDLTRLESALEAAKQAVKGPEREDVDAIRRAADELQRASHDVAEALYTQAQAAGAGAAPQGGVKEGEVVDEEYANAR